MRALAIGILAVLVVPATFAQDTKTEDKVSGSSLIDKWIRSKWTDAQVKPAGKTSDAEYLRRVYLDIVGQWLKAFDSAYSEKIKEEALQWALQRGSRSGRVAYQFARDFAGRHAKKK